MAVPCFVDSDCEKLGGSEDYEHIAFGVGKDRVVGKGASTKAKCMAPCGAYDFHAAGCNTHGSDVCKDAYVDVKYCVTEGGKWNLQTMLMSTYHDPRWDSISCQNKPRHRSPPPSPPG